MDITEAFRSEDLTKADFFDFVVTPDNASDAQTLQQFSKQMRTVNAFLGNTGPGSSEDDSNKEANNNNSTMVSNEVATSSGNYDSSHFWSDKETVRIETAILEDLNKYCWTAEQEHQHQHQQQQQQQQQQSPGAVAGSGAVTKGTDGHIYTLTVLNGIDQSATWYRPPMAAVIKEEEASVSSPSSIEHIPGGLDIDSILSQMNGFNNNYGEGTLTTSNTDGLIKSETYSYEDSGFADNKDDLANSLIIDTPMLEAHDGFNNNNNNDWKLSNNNTTTSSTNNGSPDSLLRSALQGKAFVRYNGAVKTPKPEGNQELRRVLSTPPEKTEPLFIKEDPDQIPTIVAGIDANGKVVFEEHIPQRPTETEPPPTSHHSMDDILLSNFPDDFEKLKRIANEVAESVNQYCQIDTSVENAVYSITPEQIGLLNNLSSPISITTAPVVTSSKPTTKKYKRSSGGTKSQTTVQSATSTSNGVRKERSLHYCSICSKGFKDKYSVNVHIRTHTGEKPFACSLCGKSFRQKAHLAKHYQTHIAQKNAAAAGNVSAAAKAKTR